MNWAPAARRAMRRHVEFAIGRLDPQRYAQEPAYVGALLARLDGVVYQGTAGRLEIRSTVVADRGRGSAESMSGADFAIVASLRAENVRTEKGVLGQAKAGSLTQLSSSRSDGFNEQCQKMAHLTKAVLGLEVPRHLGEAVIVREITVEAPVTGVAPSRVRLGRPQPLADYFVDRILGCMHGDTRADFINAIGNSKLSHFWIIGESSGQRTSGERHRARS